MSDAAAVAVAEAAPVTPAPLGSVETLKDFRARRAEADTPEPDTMPAQEAEAKPAAETETDASAAGKALQAKKGSLQARIDEITRERHATATERDAAKAEAAALRAELAVLKSGKPAADAEKPAVAADTTGKPDVATFDSYDAYIEALTEWKIEQRDAKVKAAAEEAKAEKDHATAQEAFTSAAQQWIDRRDAFAATDPAFETAAMPFLEKLTAGTPMGDAIMESEVGPQLALYLAQHGDEAKRIAGLSPLGQIRALGKIEAKFDAPPAGEVEKPKPASKAPAPVQVPSGGEAGGVVPDPSNISSLKTWRAMRDKF